MGTIVNVVVLTMVAVGEGLSITTIGELAQATVKMMINPAVMNILG